MNENKPSTIRMSKPEPAKLPVWLKIIAFVGIAAIAGYVIYVRTRPFESQVIKSTTSK